MNLMAKQWYVIHTYSGHENKVKTNLEKKVQNENLAETISQVVIPSEAVAEIRDGKRRTTTRKVFPGYVLVEMDLQDVPKGSDEDLKIQELFQKIRDIPGVTGFLGSGTKPVPLKQDEIDNIMAQSGARGERPRPKLTFSVGERVKVIEGPFANFSGRIQEVNDEKGKLTVEISIFGRPTPLELDVFQIERE